MEIKSKPLNIVIFVLLAALCFSYIYPLLYMIINSLKEKMDYLMHPFAFPEKWTLRNVEVMVSQFQILRYFWNSFLVAAAVTVFVTILSVLAGFGFSKLPFKGSGALYLAFVLTMMIPAQITAIPMYGLFSKLGLVNSRWGLVVCYLASATPSAILLLTANFRGIPNALLESAALDGCNYWRTVIHIVFPLGRTSIILNAMFNFIWTWNDLFMPTIMLQKNEVKTLMVALSSLVTRYSKEPLLQMTGLMLAALPAILIYLFLQKYIVKGISMGALK